MNIKRKNLIIRECDLCDYRTPQKDKLLSHMYSKHLYIRPFKCNLCKFDTTLKNDLNSHLKNVHGPTKLTCQKCNKILSSNNGLKFHMIYFHDGIKCEICNQKFWSEISIKNHIAIEHLNQKGTFLCEHCPMKFDLEMQLMRHKGRHHIEKHKCHFEGCEKIFGNMKNRNNHYKRVHLKIELKVRIRL